MLCAESHFVAKVGVAVSVAARPNSSPYFACAATARVKHGNPLFSKATRNLPSAPAGLRCRAHLLKPWRPDSCRAVMAQSAWPSGIPAPSFPLSFAWHHLSSTFSPCCSPGKGQRRRSCSRRASRDAGRAAGRAVVGAVIGAVGRAVGSRCLESGPWPVIPPRERYFRRRRCEHTPLTSLSRAFALRHSNDEPRGAR
jgi:hypothetical protein